MIAQFKPMVWEEVWEHYLKRQSSRSDLILTLTNDMTPIEKITFTVLYELQMYFGFYNLDFTWQTKVGKYTADFVVKYQPLHETEPQKKILIECDGHDFHEKTKEQAAKDKERDRFFAKEGYTVLRYTGSEIVRDRAKIFHDVSELLIPQHRHYDFGYGTEFKKELEEMMQSYGA